jgi:hypothetical protein
MSALHFTQRMVTSSVELVDFDRADEPAKSSGTSSFLSSVDYHPVACTRKRPQAHPRHRVPPPHGTVDMRVRLEESEG